MNSSRVLLLVDLNGVLCHRETVAVTGVEVDCYLEGRVNPFYYKRQGIEHFLRRLTEVGFKVAIYSAIMEKNLAPVCHQFFAKDKVLRNMSIYHQSHCKKDPNRPNRYLRHLPFVWKHENSYSIKTTLMMDNEDQKFAEWPENGIVVPEYSLEHVVNNEKNTLKVFEEYLVEMANHFNEKGFDVREYMKANPRPRIGVEKEDVGVLVESLEGLEMSEYAENIEKYGKSSVSFSEISQKEGTIVIKYSTPTGPAVKFSISDLSVFGEPKYLSYKMQIAAITNLLHNKCKIEFESPAPAPQPTSTISTTNPSKSHISPVSDLLNREEVLKQYGDHCMVVHNIHLTSNEVLVNYGDYKCPIRMECSLNLSGDIIYLSNQIKLKDTLQIEGLKINFYSK